VSPDHGDSEPPPQTHPTTTIAFNFGVPDLCRFHALTKRSSK